MKNETQDKDAFAIFTSEPGLAYFDSASTSLVPRLAVQRVEDFLSHTTVSSRRGAHRLAVRGGAVVEEVRSKLAHLLGTTRAQLSFQHSIPQAVTSFAIGYDWHGKNRNKIVVAQTEENDIYASLLRISSILKLDFEIIPIDYSAHLDLAQAEKLIDSRTGIVAVGLVPPGTGIKNPVSKIAEIAHNSGAYVICDATRGLGFAGFRLGLQDVDIVVSSANIGLLGPPGLAIQLANPILSEQHIPGIVGSSSVSGVDSKSLEMAIQNDRFESSMINLPAIAGLGGAIDYINDIGTEHIAQRISTISDRMRHGLRDIEGLVMYGDPEASRTLFGFNLGSGDPEVMNCHDVALFLDQSNIAVRSGLVCAHPLMRAIAPDGLVQASIHFYNTEDDVDRLVSSLRSISSQLT